MKPATNSRALAVRKFAGQCDPQLVDDPCVLARKPLLIVHPGARFYWVIRHVAGENLRLRLGAADVADVGTRRARLMGGAPDTFQVATVNRQSTHHTHRTSRALPANFAAGHNPAGVRREAKGMPSGWGPAPRAA